MVDLPSLQRTLFLESQGGVLVLGHTTIPKPGQGQVLVKIKATALNPADWKVSKYGYFITEYPSILGVDLSGDIVAIGEGVTKFKVGDRVMCQGSYGHVYSSFREYTLADEHHLAKIPLNITYDEAATLPVAAATSYLAMYNTHPNGLGLVNPLDASGTGHYREHPFVILGGASAIGQTGIQFAKLSGFSPIIVTASLKHTDYLKSLGATHVLDRNLSSSDLKSEIGRIANQPVNNIYDCVSSLETQSTAIEILSPGGNLVIATSPNVISPDKNIVQVAAVRELEFNIVPITTLCAKLTQLVENGAIKPNRVELLSGGLAGIVGGLKKLEENKVSGVKLVARPEETIT